MERTRVLQPGSSLTDPQGPVYYNCEHLYVGAKIVILSHSFVLLDADEYVFNYMEKDPARFKFSDAKTTKEKILKLLKNMDANQREKLISDLKGSDTSCCGEIERQSLLKIAKAYFPGILTEHVYIRFNFRKSSLFPDSLRIG